MECELPSIPGEMNRPGIGPRPTRSEMGSCGRVHKPIAGRDRLPAAPLAIQLSNRARARSLASRTLSR
jgi:hypothetical protein